MFLTTSLFLFFGLAICGAMYKYDVRRELVLANGIVWLILAVGAPFAGVAAATSDVEIWNGKITGKTREHGHYVRTYSCNCTTSTDSRGNSTTTCQTCTEDHYTVDWNAQSTIGSFSIDSEDSTSSLVYASPDPARYKQIQIGDPCSKRHSYTNYVQAVPESLFASVKSPLFKEMMPDYPDEVYDIYRNNHFVQVGFNFQDAGAWNQDLAMMLRDLGPAKQVNVIVVIARTPDPDYALALQTHWEGANKNDVVLVIGTEDGTNISWTKVLSWSKEEIFKVELQDRIREMQVINRTKIVPAIGEQVAKNFSRRHMKDFEYLKSEISPPIWIIVLLLLVGAGISAFIYRQD